MNEAYRYFEEQLTERFQTVKVFRDDASKSVLRVRHILTGKHFIVRKMTGDPEVYRKLLSIKSPYLPEIFEAASDGKNLLILEEYIEGDSMYELLRSAHFSIEETKKIALDICKALYTLHSIGIVHRDVKPENIILRENAAVLIDLDASRMMKKTQDSDTVALGTTGYAAPEQYGISQTDGRADIYALGVTMNLMLTGQHPSSVLAAGRLGRIISRCTMVHPDRRYRDVIHLMEVLRG